MTRQEIKAKARDQIEGKLWVLFAITALYVGITYLVGLIPPTWQDDAGNKITLGSYLLLFVAAPFVLSMSAIYLNVSRGMTPKIVDLFDGFKFTFKAVWLQIIMGFFTFLWMLLLIIPGVVKAISYSLSFFILADNPQLTAREALNKSKQITDGHKMDLFVLQLSFIGIALLLLIVMVAGALLPFYNAGIVMVILGLLLEIAGIFAMLFYLQPYMQTSIAYFYQDILEEETTVIPAAVVDVVEEQTEE